MKDNRITSKERIEHIVEAIEEINSGIKGHTKESFLKNKILIHAILYHYAVIGEAIRNVDPDLLEKYDYPWHLVRSFRNFILHEYHAIEFRVVWDTTIDDLPKLKSMVETIIE